MSGSASPSSGVSPAVSLPASAVNSPKSAATLTQQLQQLQLQYQQSIQNKQSLSLEQLYRSYLHCLAPILSLSSSVGTPNVISALPQSSASLVEVLVVGLKYRETKGAASIVILHLHALLLLPRIGPAYSKLLAKKKIVVEIVATMKNAGYIGSSSSHPFTSSKYHGVTLYRRLFEILSNPLYRSKRSILNPTIDVLLLMINLSVHTDKKRSPAALSAPALIIRRIRFGIPSIMELAYLIVFGTTTLSRERDHAKKTLRPRIPTSRMFKQLILIISKLSCLPPLVATLVQLGVCEWCIEVLKEMRDYLPIVSAVMLTLMNVSRDQNNGCPVLYALIGQSMDEKILRHVAPLVKDRLTLFRHTRELLWQLQLYQVTQQQNNRNNNIHHLQQDDNTRDTTTSQLTAGVYHYGYNLLDPTYFGTSTNDYNVTFEHLDRKKFQHIQSLQSAVNEIHMNDSEQEEGMMVRDDDDEDEEEDEVAENTVDTDDEQDEEDEAAMFDENDREMQQQNTNGNGEFSQVSTSSSSDSTLSMPRRGDDMFDSEGEDDETSNVDEAGVDSERNRDIRSTMASPSDLQDNGWLTVKLKESAVQASRQLRKEDVDPEELEEEESVDTDTEADNSTQMDANVSTGSPIKQYPSSQIGSSLPSHHPSREEDWKLWDYCPELWDRSSDTVNASLHKHEIEVQAAKTYSVRYTLPHEHHLTTARPLSPAGSAAWPLSPVSPGLSGSQQLAPTLLSSTMFSPHPHPPPIPPFARYPEPLHIEGLDKALQDLSKYYEEEAMPDPAFIPRVVYDRNVLGALQAVSGEFVSDPLPLFNRISASFPSNPPSLQFESRFESGNLCRATQVSPTHYSLQLSNDINTNAHTQWFFFRIRGMRAGVRYRFDIVNMEKKTSAFQKGMKPCIYSEKEVEASGIGWCRAMLAENVYYYPNHLVKEPRMKKAELQAKTPRMSLSHHLSTTRGIGDQNNNARHKRDDSFVDVEEVWAKALEKMQANQSESKEQADTQRLGPVKGEGGAMLTSFLAAELPLSRHVSLPQRQVSFSAPQSPPKPNTDSSQQQHPPSVSRTLSSPVLPAISPPPTEYHYTLSFTLSFVHDHDTVYLAHFYPYTYTYLRHQLNQLQQQYTRLIRQPLCYSRIGNVCELLTITETDTASLRSSPIQTRPVIVLSSRIHPGETNASWTLDGLLAFLCSSSPVAQHLRQLAVFKIIPMLNPDGVIEGNYRSNLSGLDLNRYWAKTSPTHHPTIHDTKRLLFSLAAEKRPVLMYVDWHGHSTMASTGLYGCNTSESKITPRDSTPAEAQAEQTETWLGVVPPEAIQLRERLVPMLMSLHAPALFDYSACTYNVSQLKAGSARVVVWQGLRLHNTYTLETTFFGTDSGKLAGIHWNVEHYREIGRCFGLACYDLVNPDRTAALYAFKQVQQRYNPHEKGKQAA